MAKYPLKNIANNAGLSEITIKKAVGCEHCNHTGYKGRIAINEYLRCDDEIKQMPKNDQFIPTAQHYNDSLGRRNLLQDGFYKVLMGVTTIDEVLRVAG
jgi:general secretion pathway protein E